MTQNARNEANEANVRFYQQPIRKARKHITKPHTVCAHGYTSTNLVTNSSAYCYNTECRHNG